MLESLFLLAAPLAVAAPFATRAQDAVLPIPTPRQIARQDMELCAFVHFGMNTFTDREWGQGNEDPKLFAPSDLDCKQWARVFKSAGFAGVVLTAKHHDGFCLWPSRYTDHSVKRSQWRGGKGDVVRELSDACREMGLKFGVYLSPWDRNSQHYGDSAQYDDYYVHQLTELLTDYGEIFEVWWDGACGEGPNGKRQVYDWKRYTEVVRRLQPNAVIFSDAGPDVRWVGNENGFAGETCWSLFTTAGIAPGTPGIERLLNEGQIDGQNFVPPECDVSIRPGWFYHASEDAQVKSLDTLLAIHQGSVGRNGCLLLNVPADKRGRIADADANRLYELGRMLDRLYANDLARGRPVEASVALALDGDPSTYFAAAPEARKATITVDDLGGVRRVNRVVVREPIALGQRVKSFRLEARTGTRWSQVAEGTTIGRKRILTFPPVECSGLRLVVTDARGSPLIASFEAYAQVPSVRFVGAPHDFTDKTWVELICDIPGAAIFYTRDGTPPSELSTRYTGPIALESTTSIAAVAFANGTQSLNSATATFRRWTPADFRAPGAPKHETEPGLRWRAFEHDLASLGDLVGLTPVKTGAAPVPDLALRTRDERCALVFDGWISIPADGLYSFFLASDDGSRLFLGGVDVIDNDGLHGRRERSTTMGLRAGLHAFQLEWFNATGARELALEWSGPGFARHRIGPAAFAR